jgi:transcriptional regulator with XRE-family HTH domain
VHFLHYIVSSVSADQQKIYRKENVTLMSFGRYISQKRKEAGLSQKELAEQITKEDGTPISAQYLNDIEHGRRNPPPEYILDQLTKVLKISEEYLFFLAGTYPKDIRGRQETSPPPAPEQVEAAFKAFRQAINKR